MRPMGNGNDAPVTVAVALGAPDRPAGEALAKRGGRRSMKPDCGGPARGTAEQT